MVVWLVSRRILTIKTCRPVSASTFKRGLSWKGARVWYVSVCRVDFSGTAKPNSSWIWEAGSGNAVKVSQAEWKKKGSFAACWSEGAIRSLATLEPSAVFCYTLGGRRSCVWPVLTFITAGISAPLHIWCLWGPFQQRAKRRTSSQTLGSSRVHSGDDPEMKFKRCLTFRLATVEKHRFIMKISDWKIHIMASFSGSWYCKSWLRSMVSLHRCR